MRIRKRLHLNVAVSVVTSIVICLMLFLALQRITSVSNLTKTAGDLMSGVLDRLVLRNDYIRNNSSRAKEQWFAKHEQIGALLTAAAAEFRGAEDKKKIAEMIEVQQSIGRIFSAIVANREKKEKGAVPAGLAREVEDRLLNQHNMRVYEVAIQSRDLLESARKARASVFRQTSWEIIAILLLLIAAAILNSRSMEKEIADRVARLRKGVAMIGDGDLEHRIDIRGDDELAELAESFNAMTAKLGGSYRDLEKEVEERKQAEKALRESEERLRLLGDNLPESAVYQYAHEPDGMARFLHFSAGVERLNGVSVEDVLRDAGALHRQILPDYIEQLVEAEARSARELSDFDMEVPMLRPDGEVRWMRLRSRPRRMPDGRVVWDGVQTDVTDRKEAEDTLQMAYDELSKMVEERTRELKEKEVLLKEIHHRVKNNLQVISSLVSLQADGSKDETVREVLRDVTYRVRSMALVHEKLYQSADLAHIDFAEYSRGLLGYLWRAHGPAAAAIRLNLDLAPVSLPVDTAVPLGLVLNELAGNALKHAFRGRSEGEVTVALQGLPEGRISLRVADDGVGFPEGLDWRQANSLGLRLVQMLAGQLGANVELNGGEGTDFEVVFGTKTEGA